MEDRNDPITNAMPEMRRKVGDRAGAASKHPGYWTDSSRDLLAGLEVVEHLAEGQWDETMPAELEPLKKSTRR
jgi:hypothetical protein